MRTSSSKRVVARHDLAGLDAGDVRLRQAEAAAPVPSGSSRALPAPPSERGACPREGPPGAAALICFFISLLTFDIISHIKK